MRLHEITDASEYLLTVSQADPVIDALLQAVGNIRLSVAGCSRRRPEALRDRTRGARPAARPLPDHLPDLKPAIL